MATHEYMTQVTEAMSKTNCLKNILAPYLETLKDIATKSGETHLWDRALPSCTFSSQSVWDISHWTKKYIFFLIEDTPGGYRPMLYIFGKLSSSRLLRPIWHVTLRLTVFEIYAVRIWDFGASWGTAAKRGDFVSGTDMYHHARFNANRCDRRRDICNRTDKKIEL